MDKPLSGPELTRRTLIDAALRLFAEKGYESVTTREIADLAAANIGSIAYHFGGKPGLRRACARHLITHVRDTLGISFARPLPDLDADAALKALEDTIAQFSEYWLSNPDSRNAINFVLRELVEAGEIAEVIYTDWILPMHARLCQLFAAATGLDPESEEVKIAVFSLVGPVFHFRIGQPLFIRRFDWQSFGENEIRRVAARFAMHTRALVAAYRRNE